MSIGSPVASEMPVPFGPRNRDHSTDGPAPPARTAKTSAATSERVAFFMAASRRLTARRRPRTVAAAADRALDRVATHAAGVLGAAGSERNLVAVHFSIR